MVDLIWRANPSSKSLASLWADEDWWGEKRQNGHSEPISGESLNGVHPGDEEQIGMVISALRRGFRLTLVGGG